MLLSIGPGRAHTPLSRTPIWALTTRPHSSNKAGGALGPEAELFAGAASRDVVSMVVAAATAQNQQLQAHQASGAGILGSPYFLNLLLSFTLKKIF